MTEPNLVTHARAELKRLGEDPELSKSIIAAIEGFCTYPGHSGGSASVAISHLTRLLNWQNLAPITSHPDEWQDRSAISESPIWQNTRNSKIFSNDAGKTWWSIEDNNETPKP